MEAIIRADSGNAGDIHVRPDNTTGADLHIFIDDSVRPDLDCGIEPGFRMNDRCRMNHRAKSEASGLKIQQNNPDALADASRNVRRERDPFGRRHRNETTCYLSFRENFGQKLTCLRPQATANDMELSAANPYQQRRMGRWHDSEPHQHPCRHKRYNRYLSPAHDSGIEVAQFAQRRVILRALFGGVAEDDMIQHVDLQ